MTQAQTDREQLIDSLVGAEWAFFQNVNNVGGRASCQDMPQTFSVMRRSQFAIWTDEALASYQADLDRALVEGRNPLAEKYGYRMESTHPDEYAQIKGDLPAVSPQKAELVEKIVAIQVGWATEMAQRYPHFMRHGRPLHTSDDRLGTSIETYSRGELKTYSEATLQLIYQRFSEAQAEGVNLQEQSDEAQVRMLGYASLAAAEKTAASGSR